MQREDGVNSVDERYGSHGGPGLYAGLLRQAQALLEGERCPLPNMANLAALLWGTLEGVNWVGFYVMHEDMLVLGPFQGKPACIRIPLGRGVCGTAAALGETQLVPDVHAYPGHIACDGASRAEVVAPVICAGKVVAVLDVDSPVKGRFTQADQQGLESLAQLLARACDWPLLLS